MEKTLKDRLIQFIKSTGSSIRQFEIKWGVSSGYVNNISKGIGNEYLINLCNQYPELDLNWLLTGKGSMLLDDIYHEKYKEQIIEIRDHLNNIIEKF